MGTRLAWAIAIGVAFFSANGFGELDRGALLAAIAAFPDEDTPRLVFADYLTETGEPERARFIRAQIEAEWFPVHSWEAAKRRKLAEQLLAKNPSWVPNAASGDVTFRRGFPEDFLFQANTIPASEVGRLLETMPTVTSLTVHAVPRAATLRALSREPRLAQLRALSFWSPGAETGSNAAVAALLRSPHLSNVTSLSIYNSWGVSTFTPQAVVGSPLMKHLTHLNLGFESAHWQRSDWLSRLAASPDSRQLRSLRITGIPLEDDEVAPLVTRLKNLTELHLNKTSLGDYALSELSRAPRAKRLRVLNLGGNSLAAAGISAFSESPFFSELHELDLSNQFDIGLSRGTLRSAELQTLLRSTNCRNLRVLKLGRAEFDQAAINVLAESPTLGNLETLNFAEATLPARWLQTIASSQTLGSLNHLDAQGVPADLREYGVQRAGFEALAKSPLAARLRYLDVRSLPFPIESLETALKSNNFPGLTWLGIAHLHHERFEKMLVAAKLPALTTLHMGWPNSEFEIMERRAANAQRRERREQCRLKALTAN